MNHSNLGPQLASGSRSQAFFHTHLFFFGSERNLYHTRNSQTPGVPDLSRSFRKCRKETFRPFRPFRIQSLIAGWFKSRSRGFADEISVAGTDPRRWAEHGRGAQGVEGVSVKLGDFQEKKVWQWHHSPGFVGMSWTERRHEILLSSLLKWDNPQVGGGILKSANSAVDVFVQVLWSMVYALG